MHTHYHTHNYLTEPDIVVSGIVKNIEYIQISLVVVILKCNDFEPVNNMIVIIKVIMHYKILNYNII